MLNRDDARDYAATFASSLGMPTVRIETKYFDIVIDARDSVEGQREIWTRVETRPAFEVAMLSRERDPAIILMKKQRLADEGPRVKIPGGYLWGPPETFITEKLLRDTGLQISFTDLIRLGQVIGHHEVITPISLYYTFVWQKIGEPRQGIDIFSLPLSDAVKLALNYGVENDSSFTALMRLYYLWKEGRLAP